MVLAGVAVGGVLYSRTSPNHSSSGVTNAGALSLVNAQVFVLAGHTPDDPGGAANVLDHNPATLWRTDLYGNAHFGNLYPGIGLALQLASPAKLHHLKVFSPVGGWSAQTFVSSSLPANTDGVGVWGTPTDTRSATSTETTFSLGGRDGSWILLWLTSTGGPPYRAEIGDVSVS